VKFNVVISDPPWKFSDGLSMSDVARGADSNYKTMLLEDIKNLDMKSIVDPNGCILAMWVPSSFLQDGMDVMKAYGFEQKQTYIWVKTKKEPLKELSDLLKKSLLKIKKVSSVKEIKEEVSKIFTNFDPDKILQFFMGRLFRQTHEICLIGINNKNIYKLLKNKSQRSVCFGQNMKHSQKPDDLHNSLELMFGDLPKIELFARRMKNGWTCLGNEIDGKDIREAIKEVAAK
jgi:N6-adenosine-specific RNA methylase IME4